MTSKRFDAAWPVGWTSESEVHRTPRRRWWTALRFSTLQRLSTAAIGDVAGFMREAARAMTSERFDAV
ncbi:hypothetical protein [Thiocapsa rosea]|uniref:Uncharacterized protein n=1 Tax=Thiocapsa rosea TaxID=69360 RepID=A0A495V4J4_9GAMM|nr:hypothetical protein [Thiocapsa rosea]RKT44239.1 hypothetical protein BDD21_1617 [Thiocapsa rosea]